MTIGPRAVKEFPNGKRAVIRFFITQDFGTREMRDAKYANNSNRPWFVIDSATWNRAEGTNTAGYQSKSEAIKVARNYRDTYGAYCRSPF